MSQTMRFALIPDVSHLLGKSPYYACDYNDTGISFPKMFDFVRLPLVIELLQLA